jgi:hypothetical protein
MGISLAGFVAWVLCEMQLVGFVLQWGQIRLHSAARYWRFSLNETSCLGSGATPSLASLVASAASCLLNIDVASKPEQVARELFQVCVWLAFIEACALVPAQLRVESTVGQLW